MTSNETVSAHVDATRKPNGVTLERWAVARSYTRNGTDYAQHLGCIWMHDGATERDTLTAWNKANG